MSNTFKNILTLIFAFTILFPSCGQDKINNDSIVNNTQNNLKTHLPNPTNWTNDFENLYTDNQENQLNKIIAEFEKETSIEIAIVTLDTTFTSKENFELFTLQLAKSWGVGKKEKNNGILIAISRGYRKMRIQNGYGIEILISDKETKTFLDEHFIPYLKQNLYFDGTLNGLTKLINLLRQKIKN